GDVALAHDIGGLLAAGRLGLKLTIVLLDNEGGGIFDFLAVSNVERDLYTTHVATPTGLDFARASALYGLGYERPEDLAAFRASLERALAAERSTLVHVRSTREHNVLLHREVWAAVARSLAG
ncbi:MAG: thiamine pyrophosphate-dependent enzyme, partial [Solirubrobacteraceae bacterium]